MPPRLTYEYNPLSYAYPDDESDKQLFLQASGTRASRHRIVVLYWVNMVFSDGEEVWQVVRLVRRDAQDIRSPPSVTSSPSLSPSSPSSSSSSPSPNTTNPNPEYDANLDPPPRRDADRYKYVYPDLIVVDGCERDHNTTFFLGVFSRDAREAVLECAEDVAYDARSDDAGQCAAWMSELLERMVGEGLVASGVVEAIRDAVPLPAPVPVVPAS